MLLKSLLLNWLNILLLMSREKKSAWSMDLSAGKTLLIPAAATLMTLSTMYRLRETLKGHRSNGVQRKMLVGVLNINFDFFSVPF